MTQKKVFTIVTPTYSGREDLLNRAIESVDDQIHSEWEHLIVSDGVLDNPPTETSSRRRVITLPDPYNDSGNTPRSIGLEQADSDYVLFLDDDNVIFPNYLSRVEEAFTQQQEKDAVICSIWHFGPLPSSFGSPPQRLTGNPPVLQNIDTLQFTARTHLMKEHGWFNMGYLADGYTIESYTRNHSYSVIPDVLGLHL